MKILCCDPSLTAFGWAVMKRGRVLEGGCIKTSPTPKKLRIRLSDDRLNRVTLIANQLIEIIRRHKILYIVSEAPHGSQSAVAAVALGLITGMVQGMALSLDIPIEWYSEGDSKIGLLGVRSASKTATIDAVSEIYGEKWKQRSKATNEAIADAISVYHCARKQSNTLKMLDK